MTLTITLDWLAMTFKEQTREQETFCDLYARTPKVADAPARNGYSTATSDKNGVVCMWNVNREEMGYHVIFAGSALRNIFESGMVCQRGLVESALNAGGSITRLDIAKDATDVTCNLATVWRDIQAGHRQGNTRTFSTIESVEGFRTIYIGSRVSERFARIYDKAGQLNLEGEKWYRYELETKGMVARALATLLSQNEEWNGCFDKMALDMLAIDDNDSYQQFFTPGVVLIGIPQLEKRSDREKWIQEGVIAAVVEHYHEHPDSKAVRLLLDALRFEDEHRE